jgi:hypothetical protein
MCLEVGNIANAGSARNTLTPFISKFAGFRSRCAISKKCNGNKRSSTALTKSRAISSPGWEKEPSDLIPSASILTTSVAVPLASSISSTATYWPPAAGTAIRIDDERKGEDPPDFEYIAPRCKA